MSNHWYDLCVHIWPECMSPPGAGGPPEKRIVGSMGMDIEDDDDDDDDDDVNA